MQRMLKQCTEAHLLCSQIYQFGTVVCSLLAARPSLFVAPLLLPIDLTGMHADAWDVELPHEQPGAMIPVDLAACDMDGLGEKGIKANTGYPTCVWEAVGNRYLPTHTRSSRGESDEMLWGYLLMVGVWIKSTRQVTRICNGFCSSSCRMGL